MSDVPTDLWRDILLRLPAKSLFRCRAVNKELCAIIDDQSFIKAFDKKHSSFSNNIVLFNSADRRFPRLFKLCLDPLDFHGSNLQTIAATPLHFTHGDGLAFPVAACGGLMLVSPEMPEQKWKIWNPTTHESLELPGVDYGSSRIVATGLGYDESTDDYKAILISGCNHCGPGEQHPHATYVYSLKWNLWKTIGNFPRHDGLHPQGPGVSIGGALLWLLVPENTGALIVSLDLETELYNVVNMPEYLRTPMRYMDVFGSYGLIVTDSCFVSERQLQNVFVWVLENNEPGFWKHSNWDWRNYFIGPLRGFYTDIDEGVPELRFLALLKDKRQFVFQDGRGFYICDFHGEQVRSVRIEGQDESSSRDNLCSAQVFPESIVRLHNFCGIEMDENNPNLTTDMRFALGEARFLISHNEYFELHLDDW